MSQTSLRIGMEYPDRLMHGTGAETDPWIIGDGNDEQNLQNFLDAAATNNSYIKITKSIDVSKSITYREGFDTYIYISANTIFAEEKIQISGLNIKAEYGFYMAGRHSFTISKIQFVNMMYSGDGEIIRGETNGTTLFDECDFSVKKVIGSGLAFTLSGRVGFYKCSIYYDTSDAKTANGAETVFYASEKYKYCSIYYKGVGGGSGENFLLKNGDHVSVTGDITPKSNSKYINAISESEYCYFAGSVGAQDGDVIIGCYSQSNIVKCLICVTKTKGDHTVTTSTNSVTIAVTADQLRDRDYLYSIGFLP